MGLNISGYDVASDYLSRYLAEKGISESFKFTHFGHSEMFENEYKCYFLQEQHENGYLEVCNVELSDEVIFSFYIPAHYTDFLNLMKLLDN